MSITFKEPDKILADIITVFMGIDATRVVLYDENWSPPKDQGIYITIQTDPTDITGVSQKYNKDTGANESSLSAFQRLSVNITSRDRTALQRKEEVVMALTSIYSQQQQELQQVRIFREGPILDLSFIEGAKALHRYQIPVKITFVKRIVTAGVPVIVPTNNPEYLEEA
jgi:hypothetical protein